MNYPKTNAILWLINIILIVSHLYIADIAEKEAYIRGRNETRVEFIQACTGWFKGRNEKSEQKVLVCKEPAFMRETKELK